MKLIIKPYDIITITDIPEEIRDIILDAHHQGRCDEDAEHAAAYIEVNDKQFLRKFLKGYGAWDSEELSDDDQNLCRLVWLLAGDLQERNEFYYGE